MDDSNCQPGLHCQTDYAICSDMSIGSSCVTDSDCLAQLHCDTGNDLCVAD